MKKKLTAVFVLLAVCLSLIVSPQTAFADTGCSWEDLGKAANGRRLKLDTCSIQTYGIVSFEYRYNNNEPPILSVAYCSESPRKFLDKERKKAETLSNATQEMLDKVCGFSEDGHYSCCSACRMGIIKNKCGNFDCSTCHSNQE